MKLEADLHVHTISSGHAFSTVDEAAKKAAEKGLKMIAITDHGPALPGGAHHYHFYNLKIIPDELYGVRILKGAEVNIIGSDGELDLRNEILRLLDVVMIAFHNNCGYEGVTKKDNTEALMKAMENPYIKIIAHPGNPIFPLDPQKIAKKAKENNIAIELNNSSYLITTSRRGGFELDLEMAKVIAKEGTKVSISSDAHIASDIGNFDKAIALAQKAGIDQNQIINLTQQGVLEFLKKKK